MSHTTPHPTKLGPAAELSFGDHHDCRNFFAQLRFRTVNDTTRKHYEKREAHVTRLYGGSDFSALADYVRRDKHTVATKRGTIAAVAEMRWCRYEPLSPNAVHELTWALDVLECDEEERTVRATLDPGQLQQLFEALRADPDVHIDTLEGAMVMDDLACRTFNIRDLTVNRWDERRRTVQCERKATELAKRKKGRYDVKPYTSETTHEILEARAKEAREGGLPSNAALFPSWNPDDVGRKMRECAKKHGWPQDVVYCCNCLRHSAAGRAYEVVREQAMAAVRKKLAHRSAGNEERDGLSTVVKLGRRGRQAKRERPPEGGAESPASGEE